MNYRSENRSDKTVFQKAVWRKLKMMSQQFLLDIFHYFMFFVDEQIWTVLF